MRDAGTEQGTISVSGTTVSYNAFTGSHYATTSETIERGMLVTMTGENNYLHNNPKAEMIYGITKSTQANDPNILGTYLSLQGVDKPAGPENPHLVMAVGNGDMWVADADNGENIEVGDYLISSSVSGHAMKDKGEYPVSYVIARAGENVDWSTVSETVTGVKHKKISVLFVGFERVNATYIQQLNERMKVLEMKLSKLER